MMRSLFSGVSGLRIHQTKMDVIANNISNVNTVGFKSSRVTFAEIFAQTTSGASRPNDDTGRGGTNPTQIGLGATVASIDLSTTQGAAQRTDNPYDIMLQGPGFFIVGDGSGKYFTRAGVFSLDVERNFVNPSGLKLYGWQSEREIDANGEPTGNWIVKRNAVQPLTIKDEQWYAPPEKTRSVMFEGNLNPLDMGEQIATMAFYDSLGNRFTTTVTFKRNDTAPGTSLWDWEIADTASHAASGATFPITPVPLGGQITFTDSGIPDRTTTLQFQVNFAMNPTGTITQGPKAGDDVILPETNLTVTGGDEITLKFDNMTQFGEEEASPKSFNEDGYSAGTLNSISIGSDGIITGLYSNSELQVLGQIAVARFQNPAGLEKFGDNLYIPTSNSGEFDGIGEQAQMGGGKIMAGVLEMSNVDLAQEFTEMITTQRGFQANSRIITVSDDMLQELVNLKR